MIFIMNFNSCNKELSDLKRLYDLYKGTNINFLLDDFDTKKTNWSVPKKAIPGDIIVFMCAKEARHNLGMATSHIPDEYSDDFRAFVDQQKILYKKYSGNILGYGIVASAPEEDDGWWMADIDQLCSFSNPVYIDEFRSFITISRTSSITYINDEQWERLKWVVNQGNPGTFQKVTAPEAEVLEREYQEAVWKETSKTIDKLKKKAAKIKGAPLSGMVRTKMYYRNPIVAAYVKKRANGKCQLCGMDAPFIDQNGEPYLECHHLKWLSKGGEDSIDNCVALCPNCHRKMHILNDPKDINALSGI